VNRRWRLRKNIVVVAYLVSRYPLLTETFVRREIVGLEELGHEILVAPLLRADAPAVREEASRVRGTVVEMPLFARAIAGANWRMLRRAPRAYVSALAAILRGNTSDPKLLAGAMAFFPKAVALGERFQQSGVQHVHAHFATHPTLAAWIIYRLTGIRYSFTAHAHDIFVHKAMLTTKVRDCSFAVAISEFNRKRMIEICGREAQRKLHVVRCGVAVEQYAAMAQGRTQPGGRRLRILTVAALKPYKGPFIALRASRILKEQLPFEWRIAGGGPLRGELQRQIRENGLESVVRLLGPCSEAQVMSELSSADLFVLPSVQEGSGKMEGVPVALMEAMAAGIPVIASRLSGIPELVRDGATGLLVEPGDAEGLAAAVLRLVRDWEAARKLAAEGRALVEREFNLTRSAAQMNALLLEQMRHQEAA
jgi:colanic acid/amylovoran biosynthesis glycosyltransferase